MAPVPAGGWSVGHSAAERGHPLSTQVEALAERLVTALAARADAGPDASLDRALARLGEALGGDRMAATIVGGAMHRSSRTPDWARRATADPIEWTPDGGLAPAMAPLAALAGFDAIVGRSPALLNAIARVREVADTDATVLLVGETGTGKELFARAVHARSPRRHRPLVRVNCAALPPSLIESELFGHERGAFTGAVNARQGRFELADRGTIFLDEIGDLPLDLQAKLLRVLQEGEFERVGSSHARTVDVRVVAATHRDLAAAMQRGEFRADLYYRLSVFPIRVPALRDRPEDVPELVRGFVQRRQRDLGRRITSIPASVIETLQRYTWPGNVRELENVIERAIIRSTDETLVLDDFGAVADHAEPADDGDGLDAVDRRHIEHVLRCCGWRINGRGNAAERLHLHPNTLRFRMKKLGIVRAGPARRPAAGWSGAVHSAEPEV